MPHPELLLRDRLKSALASAFGAEYRDTDPLLRRSDRADYQVNVAMSLGKALKRPPREVAQTLLAKFDLSDLCGDNGVEIAGPGFINLTLRNDVIARALSEMLGDPRLGAAQAEVRDVCVVDYGSPNIAKEMHAGHLRSSIIGDTLCRVLTFRGHTVIRQNHIGDWGTPFGMLLEHLLDVQAEGAAGLDPKLLTEFYQAARVKFDSDPKFADRARARVVALQAGDAATLELWRGFVASSKRYMEDVFGRLGLELSDADVRGESFFNAELPKIAAELEARGIAKIDDGALCVFPPGFAGREGEPLPLIVRKQDGGYGYAATDLAAVRFRREVLGGTRLLYVIGAPQAQHLAMVFAVANMAGWLSPPTRAEHVAFGQILGEDRKKLASRGGESVKLLELLDEAVERAYQAVLEKNPDLPDEERRRVAQQVGIGAVKYGDLSSDRIKDYVFDWKRMVAFEGNTGPYLQYAHARIHSIFRKASGETGAKAIEIVAPAERALGLELLSFGRALIDVESTLEPHKLCGYLFGLAVSFSGFFEACPVLRAEPKERASRLALCNVTARTLATGLSLLGIAAPERM
ncbi:MAG TPA: arginine--tRNA ligase [Polyangiaceae bacterium]|jgi:arginyl-tRNA synthetase